MSLDRHHMLCLHTVLEGLRLGLCEFSGPSRVALVYAEKPGRSPAHCRSPAPAARARAAHPRIFQGQPRSGQEGLPKPELVALLRPAPRQAPGPGRGGQPGRAAPAGWPTRCGSREQHPDLCSSGPTRRWLELALRQFSNGLASQDTLALDTSANTLQEMAPHAVHDFIVDERARAMGPDTRLRVYKHPLGHHPDLQDPRRKGPGRAGHLAFVEPSRLSRLHYLARLPKTERPRLDNGKHVRKMLPVRGTHPAACSFPTASTSSAWPRASCPRAACARCSMCRHGMLFLDGNPVCKLLRRGLPLHPTAGPTW